MAPNILVVTAIESSASSLKDKSFGRNHSKHQMNKNKEWTVYKSLVPGTQPQPMLEHVMNLQAIMELLGDKKMTLHMY
ncbi:hypothetical protein PROFUN_11255 [Planoprotostelium fungivorum]|uniref:Uncharacterized protein n=1 Tax=Planoprotostelium fungivorum TaxID=1890364 RepID=A0A2P6NAE4_9EUKA|nr:hypothetical protein PROFUN_11255 [Planoprotostelium fungivorum]